MSSQVPAGGNLSACVGAFQLVQDLLNFHLMPCVMLCPPPIQLAARLAWARWGRRERCDEGQQTITKAGLLGEHSISMERTNHPTPCISTPCGNQVHSGTPSSSTWRCWCGGSYTNRPLQHQQNVLYVFVHPPLSSAQEATVVLDGCALCITSHSQRSKMICCYNTTNTICPPNEHSRELRPHPSSQMH